MHDNTAHHKSWEPQRVVETVMSMTLSCLCGFSVACELVRQGERLGILSFFDGEVASSTYGERIEHCPGCSQKLALYNVRAE